MTPANGSSAARAPLPVHRTSLRRAAVDAAAPPDTVPATLYKSDGRYITGGVARFRHEPSGWTATLDHLDRPGLVASLYFVDGLRDVLVGWADGRRARARISATRFDATSRVCDLDGVDAID